MRQIVSIIAALLCSTIAFSQTTHPTLTMAASPEAGGFSSKRLSRIDTVLKEYVDKGRMNGAVAMIVHDGKIVY